jgi:hypothetical protein
MLKAMQTYDFQIKQSLAQYKMAPKLEATASDQLSLVLYVRRHAQC